MRLFEVFNTILLRYPVAGIVALSACLGMFPRGINDAIAAVGSNLSEAPHRLIVVMTAEAVEQTPLVELVSKIEQTAGELHFIRQMNTATVILELPAELTQSERNRRIESLLRDPRVHTVEPDLRMRPMAFPADPPDDTYWTNNSLWGLYGTYGIGIGASRTVMNSVWTSAPSSQGDGIVVAILDTGYTPHPDLDANYVAGYDFVSSASANCRSGASDFDGDYIDTATYGALGRDSNPRDPGTWTDVNGGSCFSLDSSWHGTHAAGVIGAVANNTVGTVGIAPRVKIQPVRVLSFDGGYTSDIADAIVWASGGTVAGVPVNTTPADVINLSLGGSGSCPSTFQTAIDTAVANGSVVVVAAGNSNSDAANFTPANCNNVIAVTASTSAGARQAQANYGNTIDIAAPGEGIYSTYNSGATVPVTANYEALTGTSVATAYASGVAALFKARDPSRTPAQILALMQSNAQAFPSTGSPYDCTTTLCGAGLLRAPTFITGSTPQSITFTNPGSQTLDTSPTITATSTSGLTVSFTSATTGVCTITPGGALTLISTGNCTINADQAGDATYAAAAQVQQTFAVVKAAQTITFAALPAQSLNQGTLTLVASASSGLPVTFQSTTPSICTVSGATVTLVAAGTCTITASQAGDSSYSAAADVTRSFAISAAAASAPPEPVPFLPLGVLAVLALCLLVLGLVRAR